MSIFQSKKVCTEKNYFIIHGTRSSQYGNWFPWLYSKFFDAGESCFVPQFPTGEHQDYKEWKTVLEGYLNAGYIGPNTVFITHSLGSVFVTRFVVEHKINIAGIISVAGFNADGNSDEINNLNKSFLTRERVLKKIANYVKFYHCIYSDNDPYVPLEVEMNFAKLVNAKVHEIEGAGHINAESGYTEFPFIWELIDKINTIV